MQVSGQVSVRLQYTPMDYNDITDVLSESSIAQGIELGVGYWFRLKEKRLEFHPQLIYTTQDVDVSLQSYGAELTTTVYPLDWHGDCNCPTFSKEDGLVKQGWHIGVIMGGMYQEFETTLLDIVPPGEYQFDRFAFRLGIMTGLDIGISNLLTITPQVRLLYWSGNDWSGNQFDLLASSTFLVHPGIQCLLRFDKKNYGFKRPRRRR